MSFGSMSGANSSLKNNRDSRRAKKDGFKANNRDVSNSNGSKTELEFKKISEEELERVKENIRKKIKREKTITISLTVFFTALFFLGLYIYLK